MYIVFAEELDDSADVKAHTIPNPGRRLCPDRLPLRPSYRFEPQNEGGWAMILTDVERPEQRKLSALRRGVLGTAIGAWVHSAATIAIGIAVIALAWEMRRIDALDVSGTGRSRRCCSEHMARVDELCSAFAGEYSLLVGWMAR